MSFFSKRKRKNDETRSPRLWSIAAVVILVLAAFFLGTQVSSRQSKSQSVSAPVEGIELTATAIIQQATMTAQGTPPFAQAESRLDPFALTATAVVKMATEQASTPAS